MTEQEKSHQCEAQIISRERMEPERAMTKPQKELKQITMIKLCSIAEIDRSTFCALFT